MATGVATQRTGPGGSTAQTSTPTSQSSSVPRSLAAACAPSRLSKATPVSPTTYLVSSPSRVVSCILKIGTASVPPTRSFCVVMRDSSSESILRGTGIRLLPGGSADNPTLARSCVQSRESAGGPDCQDATQEGRKKITAASLRKRAQCTRVSYIRDVQPHQSMPCVTNRDVSRSRTPVGVHLRSAQACAGGVSAGAMREPAARPSRVVG
ncbi:hypothetical protein XAP412_730084 [Xanthomonas phaseoli pv. phaseoli]|uniref:Uncharacterized protein n=1 Tax=Xanthomonas campestris pv. phaseoli TaxID=317013 RepID=A0AB38E3X5_XANCH|nr:hypothetical protein XAP6984_770082 [Xanthomonas phaseoli pv. phaseoli]SON89556.1 hypothetical protein XAP412_730084 [Xanthomonas phaseoli pv. phaseoli]SON92262.1 hypothetical protein XAP7430_730084 [Xanthomonas phaseoli pv. phaseoli]SOO29118.1 hypothetical protein XAP6164_3050005 [Xanthomonas phaseoli pv. phaseoli]